MLSIGLPPEIDARLKRLAEQSGQSKSDYAREVILEKIEEIEDLQMAEQVLDRIRKKEDRVLNSEQMWREFDS